MKEQKPRIIWGKTEGGRHFVFCTQCEKNPAFFPRELIILPGDIILCDSCRGAQK